MKRILVFSVKEFERDYLLRAAEDKFDLVLVSQSLSMETVQQVKGYDCICVHPTDDVQANVILQMMLLGVKMICIRAAGYDNVDIAAATECGIVVTNVPDYSPYAVAEHATLLMLALNRKMVISQRNIALHDFRVDDLIGFDMNGKTVGLIGLGKIGSVLAKILHGFGCRILGYDISPTKELTDKYNVEYVDLDKLCSASDIISIQLPLSATTRYLIDYRLISKMKKGVMLINVARGAILKTDDVMRFLDTGHIGSLGIDVYDKERGVFFYDHRKTSISDPLLKKLITYPNVIVTPHQAFATTEALRNISRTVVSNCSAFFNNGRSGNELNPAMERLLLK